MTNFIRRDPRKREDSLRSTQAPREAHRNAPAQHFIRRDPRNISKTGLTCAVFDDIVALSKVKLNTI